MVRNGEQLDDRSAVLPAEQSDDPSVVCQQSARK
jgi:hypothetical protein